MLFYKGIFRVIYVATNVFNYLDFENNEFIQLAPGNNYLRYGASDGMSNLEFP